MYMCACVYVCMCVECRCGSVFVWVFVWVGVGVNGVYSTASKVEFPEFHCYRKCTGNVSSTFFCTFYAPILYTVQVIQPGTFLVCRNCHNIVT